MQAIAEFIGDLLGGAELVALSLAVGAIVWSLGVLRLGRHRPKGGDAAAALATTLLFVGAASLAVMQGLDLGIKAWVLAATLERSPFPAFLHTIQFSAGVTRMGLAAAVAGAALWLRRAPRSRERWLVAAILCALLAVSGAWLTHAESRIENRALLMIGTTVHLVAAAAWVGCVLHFLLLWRIKRRAPEIAAIWPILLDRFSVVGITIVLVLVTTGLLLAVPYVNSWRGLIGTSYGAVLVAKIVLLGAALGLAFLNFSASRRWAHGGDGSALVTRTPYVVETEAMVLVALLFAAAALTSQPPAADTGDATASWAEVAQIFTPRLPVVTSPSHAAVMADRSTALTAPAREMTAGESWSEYNHDISGVFLVIMAIVAMIGHVGHARWTRHWPLGFIGLGLFLFLRSDPQTWPLGPEPFWLSFTHAEVLQHRLATALTFVIGGIEWRARAPRAAGTRLPYIFPFLCLAGGLLLLTHSHTNFIVKNLYLIQISHIAMGMFALLMGCARWLEIRLAPPASRMAGLGAVVAMLMIGLMLTFYKEPVG